MADLKPLEFPDHLLRHNLTETELSKIPEKDHPIAKDWNIIRRQNEWCIQWVLEIRNTQVQHDILLDSWKRWLWFGGVFFGSGGALAVIYTLWKLGGH